MLTHLAIGANSVIEQLAAAILGRGAFLRCSGRDCRLPLLLLDLPRFLTAFL